MMSKDLDGRISRWLEEQSPTTLPDRVLRSTFSRTRATRQQAGWQAVVGKILINRLTLALGGAAAVLVLALVGLGLNFNQSGIGGRPASPFVGNWEATDFPGDISQLTMAITALPHGSYELTIRDDFASVCGGASSTMTGVAEAGEPGTITIAQPEYTCDDGSQPQALSGPPLEVQLRNLSFTYNSQRDELEDSFGLPWSRP